MKVFLNLNTTKKVLGQTCIAAIHSLQETLCIHEDKLAGYRTHDLHNCMDAETTSPVVSNNSSIKGGSKKTHVNMNLDRTASQIITHTDNRLSDRTFAANRQLNYHYLASAAHTASLLIKKGQALIDRFHDESSDFHLAQVKTGEWWAWSYKLYEASNEKDINHHMTRYCRVHKMTIKTDVLDGKKFIHC